METRSLADLTAAVLAADSIVICGHMHPDGDCLGSQLALCNALIRMGKKVRPLLAQDANSLDNYRFMPGFEMLMPASKYKADPDLFISVDVPNASRMGNAADAVRARSAHRIAIDHHLDTDPNLGELTFTDPTACACGLLIWDFIKALGLEPGQEEACCCYVAVLTDTGRFQFQNTDVRAFSYATEFVAKGANPSLVADNVYLSRSPGRIKLEALCNQRLSYDAEGRIVYSWVLSEDYENAGASKEDGEELSDCVRSVKGADVCMLLRETGTRIRGSLRAKGDSINVAEVAHRLNGGGHKAAAGFNFEGSLEDCLETVLPMLRELVQ